MYCHSAAYQSTEANRRQFSLPPNVLEPQGRILRIIFADAEQIRLRKVITRSRERKTYSYWTWKLDREAQGESPNEVNGFILLDCDPYVLWFAEQCCEILYIDDNGDEKRHYPDVLNKLHGKWLLWEFKTETEAQTDEISSRTDLMVRELPSVGFNYEIKLAKELARQPRFGIADKLRIFGKRPMTFLEREQLRQHILREGALTWGNACAGLYGRPGREILCRAVLEGILSVDLNSELSHSTQFLPGVLNVWQ
jgi:hypothetical protein